MPIEILVFIFAFLAALLGPIFGIGGGTIFIPLLDIFSDLDIKKIMALNPVLSLTLSLRSNARYFRSGVTNIRFGVLMVVFAVLGAFLGAMVMIWAPRDILRGAFGILLLYAGFRVLRRKPTRQESVGQRGGMFADEYFDEGEGRILEWCPQNLKKGVPLMFFGGFAAGLLGVGGGVIYTPVLILVFMVPSRIAVTMSMFLISFSSTISSVVYLSGGLIELNLVAFGVVGSLIGSTIGSKLALIIKNETLKKLIVVYFIVVGVRMIISAF